VIAARNLLVAGRVGALDFALSAVGACLAVYAVGQTLSKPAIGLFYIAGIVLGVLVSYGIERTGLDRRLGALGTVLHLLGAFAAVFLSRRLNVYLPDEGFPRELTISAALCWMILFGSWTAWSDGRLLFQAVPCISLFALVGAIDSFGGATFAFFLFLTCAAVLYARAHHRAMLRRAEESGYAHVESIRQGPWKWVAGPEWALASAFAVVLVSLLGAPVIQESMKGVAGTVRISMPASRVPPRSPIGSAATNSTLRVGLGPRPLSERPVFEVRLDRPRYLRSATYATYTPLGWVQPSADAGTLRAYEALLSERRKNIRSVHYEYIDFALALQDDLGGELPVPGEVVELQPRLNWRLLADGTVTSETGFPPMVRVFGRSAVLKGRVIPKNSPLPIPGHLWPYADPRGVPETVAALSDQVSAGEQTDYEKAIAIKTEIETRCRYNLYARQTPIGADPVDHFLFGSTKEGYCDLFASSMVLMARAQGIPARLATGYFPISGKRNRQGWYTVKASEAHAWAELYFEGIGWVPFDPTEGAIAVPGGERGEPTITTTLFERPWFRLTIQIAIFAALFGALAIGGIWYRGYAAAMRLEPNALARAYQRFCRVLERASSRPRVPSETPSEYLEAVNGRLGPLSEPASEINAGFEHAFYAAVTAERPAAAVLDASVSEFSAQLRAYTRRQKRERRASATSATPD